jgi:hypothetical protein
LLHYASRRVDIRLGVAVRVLGLREIVVTARSVRERSRRREEIRRLPLPTYCRVGDGLLIDQVRNRLADRALDFERVEDEILRAQECCLTVIERLAADRPVRAEPSAVAEVLFDLQ